MIVEKPSPELDKVYQNMGDLANEPKERGQTSSNGLGTGQVSDKRIVRDRKERERGIDGLPEQAKGNGPAPDGTSTPSSMIYKPNMSPTSAQDDAPGSRHPSMLLGLDQVPLLIKAFQLKSTEAMDVNRAVEQADGRAKAADKAADVKSSKEGTSEAKQSKEEQGTTWRGNLHR